MRANTLFANTLFANTLRTLLCLSLFVPWFVPWVSAQEAPTPQRGGDITVAIVADPPGWDPSVSTAQEIARVTYHNVFEGLVRIDRGGTIVAALAQSWTVSPDGKVWTFTLHDGVLFHDGTPLTSDDVVAKFERATDPDSGHTHPEYYAVIQDVMSHGPQVVMFILREASASFLYNLARPDSVIYPADKADSQRSEPIGTGPFRFARYTPGSEVRLEAFADYYHEGVPYLDAATFRIIPDPNAQLAALRSGDIDLIAVALSPENALQVQQDPTLRLSQGFGTTEITLALNNARPPFDDVRVRRAITHAIDRQAITQGAMFGFGTPIGSHVSPAEPYYEDLSERYVFDPERARALLAEAGYPEGFQVRLELPEAYVLERRSGEVVAQQLAEVGITVDVQVVEWGSWLTRIFGAADYDMTIIGHSEPRDIGIYGNPDYYYRYDSAAVRELLAQAEQATSEEELLARYREVARVITEDAVNVWLFSPAYLVAARQDVHGYWQDQPTVAIDLTEVYRGD